MVVAVLLKELLVSLGPGLGHLRLLDSLARLLHPRPEHLGLKKSGLFDKALLPLFLPLVLLLGQYLIALFFESLHDDHVVGK